MSKSSFILVTIMCIVLNSFTAKSQISGDFANNNCIKKGSILVDVFYGWPYFNAVLLRSVITNGSQNVRNTNHIGAKAEYMLSDKVSLGGEFSYADAAIQYQSPTLRNYYEVGITKLRILGRFNYHFATTNELDPYFSFGMGYKKTVYYDNGNGNFSQSFNILPVSFKLAIGARYFFNDFIGMNAEFGIGGPLIQAGLSVKL